ncbi:MAG: hypothetical protein HY276_06800, partial [Ignavibacteriales bacterium]|nr:hypothetical protein [Ignavibacteriales bacterium]
TMAEPNNIHWTADAELVERFVLNRTEPNERKTLEAHLAVCENCRRVVQSEQEFAAGVRRFGRDELKARLKQRIGETKSRQLSWAQVISVAAAIVVLVTIGIYNRWFFQKPDLITTTEQISREPEKIVAAPQEEKKENQPKPAESKDEMVERKQASVPQSRGGGVTALTDAEKTKKSAQEELRINAEHDQTGRVVTPQSSGAAGGAGKESVLGIKADNAIALQRVNVPEMWVEGVMLPDRREQFAAPNAAPVFGAKALKLEERQTRDSRLKMQSNWQVVARGENSQAITLNQMLASSVQVFQRRIQKQANVGSIRTRLNQTPGGLEMTLYLDTLFGDSVFQKARVEPVNEDSLIINIGSQRIGYSIPGGWGNQTMQNKMKQKQ